MSRWFRFYDETLDDPKVQRLSGDMYKAWANLLCIASRNDGKLPSMADIAFSLRMPESKVKETLAFLLGVGLIDKTGSGHLTPHNWDRRQFKSDVTDPTAASRQQRYRERKRNAASDTARDDGHGAQRDAERDPVRNEHRNAERNGDRNATCDSGRDGERNEPVSVTPPRTDTETDSSGGGSARATPLISADAFRLAEELAEISGFPDPGGWPPGWCGAPMRVQAMLNEGWSPDVMRAAARAVVAKRRGVPIENFAYFERPLARAQAESRAPLPIVEVVQAPTVERVHARAARGNVIDAADRLVERVAAFGPRPGGPALRGPAVADPVRLLSGGGGQ